MKGITNRGTSWLLMAHLRGDSLENSALFIPLIGSRLINLLFPRSQMMLMWRLFMKKRISKQLAKILTHANGDCRMVKVIERWSPLPKSTAMRIEECIDPMGRMLRGDQLELLSKTWMLVASLFPLHYFLLGVIATRSLIGDSLGQLDQPCQKLALNKGLQYLLFTLRRL